MTLSASTFAAVTTGVLIGFLTTLWGATRKFLSQRLEIPEERLAGLQRLLLALWVPLFPLAGWLVDTVGCHSILFVGCLAAAFGTAWLVLARSEGTLYWSILALGVGGAFTMTGGIVLIAQALKTHPEVRPEASLNVGFVVIAAAALGTFHLLPLIVRRVGFHTALLGAALSCLIPATLVAVTPSAEFPQPSNLPFSLEAAVGEVRLWILAALVLLFFPIEHSLDVWPQPFLGELGYGPRAIPWLLAGFWGAFLLMRLAMGWLFPPGYELWVLLILILIPPMVLGNLVGAYASSSGYIGLWMVGACYGPQLPALLGATLDIFGDKGVPGMGLGLVLMLDPLTTLLVEPWFMRYARNRPARCAMRIPMILGLVMAGLVLVLALIRYF